MGVLKRVEEVVNHLTMEVVEGIPMKGVVEVEGETLRKEVEEVVEEEILEKEEEEVAIHWGQEVVEEEILLPFLLRDHFVQAVS